MVKSAAHPDVLVLGSHPCSYFAASLLRQNSAIHVTVADIPGQPDDDRLVVINPEFFDLHPSLAGLKRKLDLAAVYGLRFLADDPKTSSEFTSRGAVQFVGTLRQVRGAMLKLAEQSGVERVHNDALDVQRVDEHGVEVSLGARRVKPKLLIVSFDLPAPARRVLGLPEHWEPDVVHRYTYLRVKAPRGVDLGAKPLLPMSLDLRGQLTWGWLLPGPGGQVQFAVEQPLHQMNGLTAQQLMKHWCDVLVHHEVIPPSAVPDPAAAISIDIPFAGALAQEDVANRTLLIGPAGGFFTACAEEVYPACWSAVFAADAARRALKEKHLQDALQSFRQKWGATLGDYLRGPQQNLRFLLPLVYRNRMMTARLAEAILHGKSVVR